VTLSYGSSKGFPSSRSGHASALLDSTFEGSGNRRFYYETYLCHREERLLRRSDLPLDEEIASLRKLRSQ